MSTPSPPPGAGTAAVRAQMGRILASPVFSRAERLRRFLCFGVDAVLDGSAAILKEHTIGVAVYERGASYDVRLDPIVRVEAARLRAKLREYYETDGRQDPLLIEMPKGSYAPRWRIRPAAGAVAERTRKAPAIAVLPFVNLTGDASDEYFSDGLTEEIIHVISRTTGLRVVARTSVFHFKGRTDDIRAIGARLGAAVVLEGSVRRCGDRVRITAHLIDASDGCELWTDAYDRASGDVMALQQELAAAIAAALRLEISRHDAAGQPVTARAHDLYLRGRHLFNRRTAPDVQLAADRFTEALAIHADYHAARAGLANCHSLLAYWEIDKAHHFARSVEEARTVLVAAPDTTEAYIPLAYARIHDAWDWDGAERELLAAVGVDAGAPEAHHLYAYFCLMPTGRLEQAIDVLQYALELDPLSPDLHATLGRALTLTGRHGDALAQLDKGLELAPSFRELHWQIGLAHEQAGEYEQALRAFATAGELSASGGAVATGTLGHCLARAGATRRARRLLLPGLHPAPAALIHLGLDDTDAALAALEAAAALRHRLVMWLKVDPRFRPLQDHPRFETLLSSIGLGPRAGAH